MLPTNKVVYLIAIPFPECLADFTIAVDGSKVLIKINLAHDKLSSARRISNLEVDLR